MKPRDYELLYDLPEGEYQGRGVEGVRTATIRAGRSLEVMCYPLHRADPGTIREARRRKSTAAMEKLNARNRERKHMRLLEENFTERAVVATLTYAYPEGDYGMLNLRELAERYDRQGLPWEEERAEMDFRNFIARLKRRVKAAGGDPRDLKWDKVLETGKKPPAEGLPPKMHFHCVLEGPGITRETVEACWEHGRAQTGLFDLANDGAARLARYLNKNRGGRRWSHSRNLKIPAPRVSDRRMSRRRLARVAADVQHSGRAIFEALYPGYRVVELPDVKYSDFLPGCYIYARLRKTE